MSLFAHLEIEGSIQLKDKTRLNASKCFVSKDESAATGVTVKPGASASAISVFNSDSEQWFLDWQFDTFNVDIDSTNNKINFKESGAELTATLASGTYTLAQLATQIKTQLDTAGTQVYTVTYDINDKITISAPGSFTLLAGSGANKNVSLLPIIGFVEDTTSSASHTGIRTEYLTKAVTVTISNASGSDSKTFYTKLYSEAGDALFSNDSDLTRHEYDILKWIPAGRASFKNMHRRAQDLILAWLDEKGYENVFNEKFNKRDIIDIDEVRQWSTFLTLRLIFESISNSVDDIFMSKSKAYKGLEVEHRNRAILRIDIDEDGVVDTIEGTSLDIGQVFRR